MTEAVGCVAFKRKQRCSLVDGLLAIQKKKTYKTSITKTFYKSVVLIISPFISYFL